MRITALVFALSATLAACAPHQLSTSTLASLRATSTVAHSTSTPTPKPSPTHIPTQTPTATPTAQGGAAHFLAFVENDNLPANGSFYTMTVDGSDQRLFIDGSLIEAEFLFREGEHGSALISENASRFAFVTCRRGTCEPTTSRILLFDEDLSHTAALPFPGRISNVDWSPDGSGLIVQVSPGNSVGPSGYSTYVVDTSLDSFGTIFNFGKTPLAFWSSDSQHIYFISNEKLQVSDRTRSNRVPCSECRIFAYVGASSPDGQHVAVASSTNSLFILPPDLSTARTTELPIGEGSRISSIVWSPNSQGVALEVSGNSSGLVTDIIIVSASGDTISAIPMAMDYARFCGWTPDSRSIVASAAPFGGLYFIPIAANGLTPPTIAEYLGSCPIFLEDRS